MPHPRRPASLPFLTLRACKKEELSRKTSGLFTSGSLARPSKWMSDFCCTVLLTCPRTASILAKVTWTSLHLFGSPKPQKKPFTQWLPTTTHTQKGEFACGRLSRPSTIPCSSETSVLIPRSSLQAGLMRVYSIDILKYVCLLTRGRGIFCLYRILGTRRRSHYVRTFLRSISSIYSV